MKYVKQILIILGIALAGELLRAVIPLPIPGSIYGLAILFFSCFVTYSNRSRYRMRENC